MLILSRQRDQVLRVTLEDGRTLDLTVVDVRGDKVRIGIAAPDSIQVDRLEVWRDKQRRAAERTAAGDGYVARGGK